MKTSQVFLLGASLVIAAMVFGIFFYSARAAEESISVVGAATKRFESDIVKWRITISRNTGLANVSEGYALVQKDLRLLNGLLGERGIKESDITFQPINTMAMYSNQGGISGYTLQQTIFVITSDLEAIEGLALNPGALTDQGVVLQSSNLEYFYSKLSNIKMALLSEATLDTRRRAEEIAGNSGIRLGPVISMKAGVFQITEPFSAEVSDYGMYNTQTKQKDITVTVRAAFKIE